MRHIIAILLQNEAGALSRVAGLFSTRGYNIESLSVAPTEDATVSRITLVTKGSEAVIQQIVSHLNKLVDVVSVEDMTLGEHLERELVLLKLKVRTGESDAVRGYVVRTGGRVLDPAPDGFVVELTASEAEVTAFVADLARQAQILEVARSGALGMGRSARAPQNRALTGVLSWDGSAWARSPNATLENFTAVALIFNLFVAARRVIDSADKGAILKATKNAFNCRARWCSSSAATETA